MVRLRMSKPNQARLLVALGILLASLGAALIYSPAGLIVAGVCVGGYGLFFFDVEGARESGSARPPGFG